MKVSTILTRRRFSVWWEYARQWMFRTLVTKRDLKDEIGEVAKEISVQNVHKVVANKREFVPSAEIKDGAVIFRFLTFKQMEKIRILGEDVYITFRLAYDNDEEEITLLTTSDSTLPNEWIDAVGFAYENNVKDSISVEVGTDIASKIDTIEIDGLFGNLLTSDATWRLAETRKAIGEINEFFGLPAALPEGYEFMTAEEVCSTLEDIMTSMDLALTPQQAQAITQQTLTQQ